MNEEPFFFYINGEERANKEKILAYLLKKNVLFCNTGYGWHDRDQEEPSTILYVCCNDLFAWGVADAENLPIDKIGELFKYVNEDPRWGADKWCCMQRRMQPQQPVIEQMKEEGAWTEKLEALPKNPDQKR